MRYALLTLVCLTSLSGCFSARNGTILTSTSPLPAGLRGTIPAYGSDCQYKVLGIIPVSKFPDSQAALNKAKISADVDVLTDVTIDNDASYFILFSNSCVRVQGLGVSRDLYSPHIP